MKIKTMSIILNQIFIQSLSAQTMIGNISKTR
jgi:hypothetical protein